MWEDNVKMYVREIGWKRVECVYLAQDKDKFWAVVYMVMNFQVPYNVRNFLTISGTISLSRTTLIHRVS